MRKGVSFVVGVVALAIAIGPVPVAAEHETPKTAALAGAILNAVKTAKASSETPSRQGPQPGPTPQAVPVPVIIIYFGVGLSLLELAGRAATEWGKAVNQWSDFFDWVKEDYRYFASRIEDKAHPGFAYALFHDCEKIGPIEDGFIFKCPLIKGHPYRDTYLNGRSPAPVQ